MTDLVLTSCPKTPDHASGIGQAVRDADASYAHCGHFGVEQFGLNQSSKIDFGKNTFVYQCKNSTAKRLFPSSKLGQIA